MEHDDLAVPGKLNVQLDAVAVSGGSLKGGNGIFRNGFIALMKSAVGEVAVFKGLLLPPAELAGRNEENKPGRSRASGERCVKEEFRRFTHNGHLRIISSLFYFTPIMPWGQT